MGGSGREEKAGDGSTVWGSTLNDRGRGLHGGEPSTRVPDESEEIPSPPVRSGVGTLRPRCDTGNLSTPLTPCLVQSLVGFQWMSGSPSSDLNLWSSY